MKLCHLWVVLTAALSSLSASAQDWAAARLEKSPRHLEWVKVERGDRSLESFLAYPEVKEKATAVVVIHEIFGLTDWVRGVADQLAEAGYIAIAPDLLSGTAPGGGGTKELGSGDAVRKAISSLPPDQITADLNAVVDYVAKLPACNGKVAVAGFCWGGIPDVPLCHQQPADQGGLCLLRLRSGTQPRISRGSLPRLRFLRRQRCPCELHHPTVQGTDGQGWKEVRTGHLRGRRTRFHARGEAPDASAENKTARQQAWQRWKEILREIK